MNGVRLFVGGHADSIAGEPYDLSGDRLWTSAHAPGRHGFNPATVTGLIDSGAFTDPPERRLTPDAALARQLRWEERAADTWGAAWRAFGLVSYDRLIDETWVGGERTKRRWNVKQADSAVRETVDAADYLASRRADLAPRKLILSAQGVDAIQYAECAAGVLGKAKPGDILGLGGWCILGRMTSYLPELWRTIRLVVPMTAVAGLDWIHIFGVLYLPALGGLLWLADQYNIRVSTDSTAPVLSCAYRDPKKAGVRVPGGWRANAEWWRRELADLRQSKYYREPPDIAPVRQLELFH